MLWDTHVHTHFSGDAKASPEEMIQAAQKMGLAGICFTDHVDWDFAYESDMYLLDEDAYIKACQKLMKETTFQVCMGLEAGFQPHLATRLDELIKKYAFDFIILSSHMVHSYDPADKAYYYNKTEDEAYKEYFESILENIRLFDNYDVYGHLDYVVRYGPNKNAYYTYEKFRDIIDEILKKLISMEKGIEINTSGFKYKLSHPHPTEAIIKRYRELGGEIITIGADAHTPEHVAYDFDKVPAILKEAGFKYFTVFKERKPEFILLP